MRSERDRRKNGHLTPEEVETLAEGGCGGERHRRLDAHLRRCAACRREVALWAALDAELKTLPCLRPSPGFAERVMARVRLPVPWHRQLRAALYRHRAAAAAALSVTVLTVGTMAYWLFGRQGLAPSELASFALQGARTLAVRGLIAAGRLLYELRVVELGRGLAKEVALPEAAAAMALLGLVSLGAVLAMRRLMMTGTARPGRARS